MQTLFTGVPGSGKTAAGVDLVAKLTEGGKRPLYVIEIPEDGVPPISLKIPHTLIGPDAPVHKDPTQWHKIVPDGCVLFVPEAQRFWPARSPSAKVPEHVEAIGQHRHRGIDIVIDTQGPKLLDDKVRLRVGRHVHLRDLGVLGRHWYEWPECGDPGQWRSAPIKVRYRLPKRVFALYTSASLHVKPVRKFPPMLIALCFLLPLLALAAYRSYRGIADKAGGASTAPASVSGAASGPAGSARAAHVPITAESLMAGRVPRLPDEPWTAPMFDHLRRVVAMPLIAGGWCVEGGRCTCYFQHGFTAPITDGACRLWVKERPFDPYREIDRALDGRDRPRDSARVIE